MSAGRSVFGLSAVLFGVIALAWHDAETWQSLSRILRLPLGMTLGNVLMLAQIAGGIGLLASRSARPASVVLAVVYGVFSLACIPGIVAHPTTFAPYDGFFEQFALFCGALAAYAATETEAKRAVALGRTARVGIGLSTVSFTTAQAVFFRETAGLVPAWIPPNGSFWAILTTVAFALAAVAILFNVRTGPALRLMTLMLISFGVLVWVPLVAAHPREHGNWSELALTFLIAGAAWVLGDLTLRESPRRPG